jgi:hypothetical protein
MLELYWHIAGGGGGGGGGGGATQFGLEAGMLSRPGYVHITSGRAPPIRKLKPPRTWKLRFALGLWLGM